MRLLSYLVNGEPRFGAAVAGGVVDLTGRIGSKFPDLRSLIAGRRAGDRARCRCDPEA